jgi:predicted MFS family arabinose efflux permease
LLIIPIAQKFGANAVVVGFIFSVASVGGIIGAIFARYYAGKLELIKTITWGRWLIAITYALLFFATTPSLLGIAVGLYYAVGPVYGTVLSSYRISLIPDAMQGRVTGVFRIIMYIGLTAGSMIAGFLSQTAGVNYTLYLMCVLLFTLAVIASIYFRKYPNSSRSNI